MTYSVLNSATVTAAASASEDMVHMSKEEFHVGEGRGIGPYIAHDRTVIMYDCRARTAVEVRPLVAVSHPPYLSADHVV